jgi:hypothetical protein
MEKTTLPYTHFLEKVFLIKEENLEKERKSE